jgi:hypothetical protein
MANPRKFSEKIALLNQKEAEGNAEFERIMREVSEVSKVVNNCPSIVESFVIELKILSISENAKTKEKKLYSHLNREFAL